MATRRMFSVRLINSAKFLRMPISSQALYFHLGLHADDDGVVEAYPVIRMVGCTEDDLRVLVTKGFVRVLNDDLVAFITDWNEHNKIRADRKIDSIYKDLLLELMPDAKLLERKERADAKRGQSTDGQWTDSGQPMDGQRTAQDRIGKDRLGEDRININALARDEFEDLWKLYPKKQGKADAEKKYIKARKEGVTFEEVKRGIEAYVNYIKVKGIKPEYIKMGSSFFNQRSWQDDWSVNGDSRSNEISNANDFREPEGWGKIFGD